MASIPSTSILGSPLSRSNSTASQGGSPRAISPILAAMSPERSLNRVPSLPTKSFQEEQLKFMAKENEELKKQNEELKQQYSALMWQHQEMMLLSLNMSLYFSIF
eukprot:TRINITY_DN5541_c0_g2_i2.p1 TRINITY_DN5541_c0_g2~~TRINITY_DN5541_c0_g2_i2.p1  ORF type:complete len:105 (+),score=25.20 TRINITY_DN5541_c0_g2_i2:125-439(+)